MIKSCKICEEKSMENFISFGNMPVANAFLKKEDLEKDEFKYDMSVGFCKNCKMVQLEEIVPYDKYIVPETDGKTNYLFYSSTSKFMENHFSELAKEVEDRFLDDNKNIVEIGSNDGIMLKSFKKRENVLGIEPADNVAEIAKKQGIETMVEFFTEGLAKKIVKQKGKSRSVLSTNVTLNIIDIHDFMNGVKILLDNKGVFITEDPHIKSILNQTSYDQIYDEHIWYFSLHSLSNLYDMHQMEIFDAEKQWVHGGSMRVYASHKGAYKKTKRLEEYIREEKDSKITDFENYQKFGERVKNNKLELLKILTELKSKNNKIIGYGASCKGTIVQNYCGLNNRFLDYICDSTPMKQGLYTPGTRNPIVSPDHFHKDKEVDYALLFIWNHSKEVIEKEKEFLQRGGKFITHLPKPRIL